MCDPVFFRHMAPPMRVPELYRVEKIRPALVQHYIIESALLFYLYHRSARSIPLDTCLDYYPSLSKKKRERKSWKIFESKIIFHILREERDFATQTYICQNHAEIKDNDHFFRLARKMIKINIARKTIIAIMYHFQSDDFCWYR